MSSKYVDDEDNINEGKTNDSGEGSKTKDGDEPPPLEEVTTIDPFKPTPPKFSATICRICVFNVTYKNGFFF